MLMQQTVMEAEQVMLHTYNRYPICFDHGEGVYLYDTEGKKYLDFAAGIAVYALGYSNQELKDVLKNQIDKIMHISNYYYSEPMLEAAQKLCKVTRMDRVFFTNSGTEAIEGALKMARRYYYNKTGKTDSEIIAMNHSFHGRSMGALSVTGTPKYREPFEPLIQGVKFAEFNNLQDLKEKMTERICAVILEPIQGEGGIYQADTDYLRKLRDICSTNDILLILDEIQCGMGRTGSMFAHQQYGILPDIMTTAKALGCGVPVGAFLATEKAAALEAGDHGSTYGGNPLVTAAISKVLDLFEQKNILKHVNYIGNYLSEQLQLIVKNQTLIKEHRGIGLMQALEFKEPVKDIITKCQEKGLILINAGANTLRFVPPLIIEKSHVDEMISILEQCL